jgi:hypothetical protein
VIAKVKIRAENKSEFTATVHNVKNVVTAIAA